MGNLEQGVLRSGRYRIAGYDPSHTALRVPRERYHMFQLVGWAGIKPALLLFRRSSPMLVDAYPLGFGRAISLKEFPLQIEGPL